MHLDDLKRLAGVDKPTTSYGGTISRNSTELAKYARENNIRPGTDEWFRLWFALPHLTGEQPYDGGIVKRSVNPKIVEDVAKKIIKIDDGPRCWSVNGPNKWVFESYELAEALNIITEKALNSKLSTTENINPNDKVLTDAFDRFGSFDTRPHIEVGSKICVIEFTAMKINDIQYYLGGTLIPTRVEIIGSNREIYLSDGTMWPRMTHPLRQNRLWKQTLFFIGSESASECYYVMKLWDGGDGGTMTDEVKK